jgi:phosphoglycerol transferase MdoB-like AlkP superfamily enzyme
MRERLRLFGFFAIFWLCFQVVIRAAFLIYNHSLTAELTATEIAQVFLNGLKMDISMCGYFLMATGLILSASVFSPSRWVYITLNTMTIVLLLLSSIIAMVDLELYRHWGFRLNTTPFLYIGPEAFGSVDMSVVINLLLIFLILFSGAIFVYMKALAPRIARLHSSTKKAFIVLLILSGSMFIAIRGSFTVAPMNTGFVYFHKTKTFANHAAINVVWNFLYSLQKSANLSYPEDFFDKEKSKVYFKELYLQSDSTFHLFHIKKPNVVLFILESFTADIIEPLGGKPGVAPNLSELCHEGILFDNFYASGDRTDKGLISILSGYPAQPATSIIKFPSKAQSLPMLNRKLIELGYHTSFTYGGDVDFANLRSYLTTCRFDHITSLEDFDDPDHESKWGIHDHVVFQQGFKECDSASAPFFKVILSLSSHEPFDVPMTSPFLKDKNEESLFLNSCYYTDHSIGTFVAEVKKSKWWKNTVIIFVADHGHRFPGNKEAKDRARFKIPFLMIGGAIKSDTIIHTYGSQTDIANTLLGQLQKTDTSFAFSKNLLAPNIRPFAQYFFNDGYGYVAPGEYAVFDNTAKQFVIKQGITNQTLEMTKAYQQMLYSDYNKRR